MSETRLVRELVGEPGELLSSSEIAQMLGVGEEAVRQRQQAGKLIAIRSEGSGAEGAFQSSRPGTASPAHRSSRSSWPWAMTARVSTRALTPPTPVSSSPAETSCWGGFTPVEVLTRARGCSRRGRPPSG